MTIMIYSINLQTRRHGNNVQPNSWSA